jgi:hypothetical protein
MLKIKDTYLVGRKVNLKNGSIWTLWKDPIHNEIPLCVQFPILFDLCIDKDCTIKEALDANLVIHFRRTLRGENLVHWNAIKERMWALNLSADSDFISWSLNQNKIFSTKSVYHWLERNLAGSHNKWIWKLKFH